MTKEKTILRAVLAGILALNTSVGARTSQAQGKVCHNPSVPCTSVFPFASHDLSFRMTRPLVFGGDYQSAPFYAIILESVRGDDGGDNCAYVPEKKRLEAQALFPNRKVFASRTNASACDVEEIVFYTNVNRDYNFLAVYAGATLAEARRTLSAVRATGRFPQANIRKMQVLLSYVS
jgi:hypothetical protein